jgi:2-hydroxy-6-oxonona-2,4-dienedioate hydrolase
MVAQILPVRPRRLGLLNDANVLRAIPRYDLERIDAPALLISVRDDLFGTYEIARYTAAHLPNARFAGYETGGHLWVGHHEEMIGEIVLFLDNHVHRRAAGATP